jgi:hypothetical protein
VKLVNNDLDFRDDASDGVTVGLPHIHTDDLDPAPLRHVPQIFRDCRCITAWQEIDDGSLFHVSENTAILVKQVATSPGKAPVIVPRRLYLFIG